MPRESNEAHRAITATPEGRAAQRSVVWYAAAAELRRATIALGGIAGSVIVGLRTPAAAELALAAIVAVATLGAIPSVRDVLAKRIHAAPPPEPTDGPR